MDPMVTLEDVSYSYANPPTEALRDVSFGLPRGAFCAIMGPNGSGKSTLIKVLMGLLKPAAGRVSVSGLEPSRDTAQVQRLIGYVPQHETINRSLPLRARDAVHLAASTRLGSFTRPSQLRKRVDAALSMVDMLDMAQRPFKALSGGQQQRVLIARALAVDPMVLVLDEPFARVDTASQQAVGELLHSLAIEKHVTVISVVHDINPICHYVSHTLLLQKRQIAFGDQADVLTATNLQEAYGAVVPVLVCEEGYRHPVIQTSHE